jgi:hypothetical protein
MTSAEPMMALIPYTVSSFSKAKKLGLIQFEKSECTLRFKLVAGEAFE